MTGTRHTVNRSVQEQYNISISADAMVSHLTWTDEATIQCKHANRGSRTEGTLLL